MESKRWRGLPLQMFTIMALPLIVLLVGLAMGGLTLHQRAMRTLVGERDERAARAAAAAINEQLSHRGAAIHGLMLRAEATSALQETLADTNFLLSDFDRGIALFTSDGRLQQATNESEWWQNEVVAEQLAQIEPGAGPQWLPVFIDPGSGQPLMLVSSRSPSGIVALGAFSPEGMIQRILLDVFGVGDQATTFVLDAQGRLLSLTGHRPRLGPDLSQHPGALGGLRGESGTNYLSTEEGELVIAFSPVVLANWALVIEEPWQTVADPLLRVTEMAPFLMVPLLFITVVGLWFGVRQVVQPLQQLEYKATELAWGDFAAIEESVGGILEVQRLQSELIHLARKVQSAQQSMRGYLGAITAGQEEERRRLARELHDDTIQSLIALNQRLQLAQLDSSERPAETAASLTDMQQMTTQIIADLRRLTRDLRPIYLEDLGLVPALDMLVQDIHQLSGVAVEFTTSGDLNRLSAEVELALYRIAQEALSNVVRHARAKQVTLQLAFLNPGVRLTISDDGQGFVVPESPAEMAPHGHFGLLGLHERAELIGGHLTVQSEPGAGTQLVVVLAGSRKNERQAHR